MGNVKVVIEGLENKIWRMTELMDQMTIANHDSCFF